MVLLAPDRGQAASRRGAAGVPGPDQVPEPAAGQPPGFPGPVVALVHGDRGEGDLQPADHVLGWCHRGGGAVGFQVPWWPGWIRGVRFILFYPGWGQGEGTAAATVGDGGAVRAEQ